MGSIIAPRNPRSRHPAELRRRVCAGSAQTRISACLSVCCQKSWRLKADWLSRWLYIIQLEFEYDEEEEVWCAIVATCCSRWQTGWSPISIKALLSNCRLQYATCGSHWLAMGTVIAACSTNYLQTRTTISCSLKIASSSEEANFASDKNSILSHNLLLDELMIQTKPMQYIYI